MAILEDHLARFHKMTDAKEMWEAIQSRFGGNDESKKMQKYILKQQFESFSVSNSKGLHKGYDMFQSLLSQLKIHGAVISTKDTNQKFLRSLPASWSQVSLVMRTKLGVDNLSFDDLYNNLRVFEPDVKGSTGSSSSVDEFDLEEMDLKWQVAMISMRLKKFYKKTGRNLQFDAKEPVGFDKTKVECFNCHKTGHFARECRSKGNQESRRRDAGNTGYKDNGRRPRKHEELNALLTLDGEGVDWTSHAEDEQDNFALMAYSNSGLDTEVTSYSKECKESYAKLKKLYDEQREQLGDASIEIQAYTQDLKKVEAQLVCHQKNQLSYEEKNRFMKIDLDDKTDVLIYHKKLLAEAMSAKDKSGLGYGDQIHEGILSYENDVFNSVFDNKTSDVEDSPVYDRFAKVEGMHAVPPPMIGNYMPPKSDFRISNSSVETLESVPKLAVNEPKVVIKPKVWSNAPIIEEYEEPVKEENTNSQSSRVDKRNWNGLMAKFLGLGYGFIQKACFVCGSFSHLIRDCDFHEKRMAKHVELNKQKCKGTGQRENRPVWNNVQRLNYQNNFVPQTVLTKIGRFLVNAARQNLSSQATTTGTARKVHTARPIMNEIRLRNNFYKSRSPIKGPFNRTIAPKVNFTNHKVNTNRDKIVSAVGGNRETAVKASAGCNWRSKRHCWNKVSKYNSGSSSSKNDDPQKALKNKGIIDSGCSRHMTRNRAYLVEYQDYNGSPVAFGGSKGQITCKGKIITRKLDFEDVCFVKELKQFNLFSVSQMCDKKNKVLFTDFECLVLSSNFKLPDENQVLLRVPKQNNMYSFNLENIVPSEGNKLNVVEKGPNWLFDLDYLTDSINYQPVTAENEANKTVGPKEANHTTVKSSEVKNGDEQPKGDTGSKTTEEPVDQEDQAFLEELERLKRQEKEANDAAEDLRKESAKATKDILNNPSVRIFTSASYDDEGAVADFTNLESTMNVNPIPTLTIHSSHPKAQILRDPKSAVQTRSKVNKSLRAHAFVKAMQEELLQFKIQKVWILVYSPFRKKAIGIKWVYRNKKDERGFVDPKFPKKVYKVVKALYALHQAPRAWFQVTPKTSHLNAVKRIFRYLNGKPKLGLWYPRVSEFDLEAYSDSDYARANLDRKSTTGGCQFLGKRLISWQCKKQTIVATSTTEAEYVVAANCCGQVLWIQNQMLDYGFNFMNTKIYIDNESTICIVKNLVFHSKTKHIEIRHHFIRDA
ncbi:ribonuclease H-like domain-containing protein [Tanacetum coccineum]